jgi:hypothetical protein
VIVRLHADYRLRDLPASSMTKVERLIPIDVLPYMVFSTQTP